MDEFIAERVKLVRQLADKPIHSPKAGCYSWPKNMTNSSDRQRLRASAKNRSAFLR
jgi:hypothetical protein